MGIIQTEILRLETERLAKEADEFAADQARMSLQKRRMRELIPALLEDKSYLLKLRICLLDPETGREINGAAESLTGVTIADTAFTRFGDITLEYHCDSKTFSAVEWGESKDSHGNNDPFERQRNNFETAEGCLLWLAKFIYDRVNVTEINMRERNGV